MPSRKVIAVVINIDTQNTFEHINGSPRFINNRKVKCQRVRPKRTWRNNLFVRLKNFNIVYCDYILSVWALDLRIGSKRVPHRHRADGTGESLTE